MRRTNDQRPSRRSVQLAWIASIASIASTALLTASCGPSTQQLQQAQLAATVDGLRSQLARYDAKIASLSDELVVLSEQLAHMRTIVEATRVPDGLKVVRLQPRKDDASGTAIDTAIDTPTAASGHQPTDRNEEPPIAIIMDESGILRLDAPEFDKARTGRRSEAAAQSVLLAASDLFGRALRHFRQGEIQQALEQFEAFEQRFPNDQHAADAIFWIGECAFELALYDRAAEAFTDLVQQHVGSAKFSEALLKLGLTQERRGAAKPARQAFADLIAAYPDSALADVARAHLERSH